MCVFDLLARMTRRLLGKVSRNRTEGGEKQNETATYDDLTVSYPCGLFVCHLHRSLHASSNVLFATNPNSFCANVGSAVRSGTSPSLLPTISYSYLTPVAFSMAATI